VSPKTQRTLTKVLEPLIDSGALLGVRNLRAVRSGALMFVDLIADVPPQMSIQDATQLDQRITSVLKEARREISEVRVKFHVVESIGDSAVDTYRP
jgi:divalent metal cation (Fe/Co/Zn/Cd) transporter